MKGNFTQVPNDLIGDPNLSAVAKAVYAIMLSKPPKWDFTIKRISEEMKESHDTVNKGLKELRDAGWIDYQRNSYRKTNYKINTETIREV